MSREKADTSLTEMYLLSSLTNFVFSVLAWNYLETEANAGGLFKCK